MPTLTTSNEYLGIKWNSFADFIKSFSSSNNHRKNQSIENKQKNANSIYKTFESSVITFKGINDGLGESIPLKKYITINIVHDGDYYCADFDDLDIHCVSKDIKEVKEMFSEEISMIKDMYLDCDENELSESAKEFRKTVAEYI